MRLDDDGSGVTRDSVRFFRDNRERLGPIVSAAVRFPGFGDPFDPYLLVLRDDAGNEMRLSGCTTGYAGEGPRATMQILVDEGFLAAEARAVFTAPELALQRTCEAPPTAARRELPDPGSRRRGARLPNPRSRPPRRGWERDRR